MHTVEELTELLRISRQSEKEAWRYKAELEADLASAIQQRPMWLAAMNDLRELVCHLDDVLDDAAYDKISNTVWNNATRHFATPLQVKIV